MGKLFDKAKEVERKDLNPVEKYLLNQEFYNSTMNPRFMDVYDYDKLTIGEPCLRYDLNIKDGYTLRIFINTKDIYYEVQNPWRSYDSSGRYEPNNYLEVEDIDNLLDEILKTALGK